MTSHKPRGAPAPRGPLEQPGPPPRGNHAQRINELEVNLARLQGQFEHLVQVVGQMAADVGVDLDLS